MKFRLWLEENSDLYQQLVALRPQLAAAAQAEYDEWEQGEEGLDAIVGGGGICDAMERAMSEVVGQYVDANITSGGQPGDDHAWLVVYDDKEAYGVDIPPDAYEQGGGMSWKKMQDVTISPEEVQIWKLDIPASEFKEEW